MVAFKFKIILSRSVFTVCFNNFSKNYNVYITIFIIIWRLLVLIIIRFFLWKFKVFQTLIFEMILKKWNVVISFHKFVVFLWFF